MSISSETSPEVISSTRGRAPARCAGARVAQTSCRPFALPTFGVRLLALICAVLLVLAPLQVHAQTSFYTASPQELVGAPGTLIRREAVGGAPLDARAYRILYRSTGLKDEPIAVSGLVIVPQGAEPSGGRSIIAWAHPTTGIVPRCAPSLALFKFQQIQGLRSMIAQGFIVAATDYPGLGTPGPHPYLVGRSEGRAVLDSVRAARELPGPRAAPRFAVWGHSQGGQAALYAGLIAATYAPELELVGVAAAAPATDLAVLMRDDLPTPGGKNLLAMTLWSWARVFGAPLDQVVAPAALPTVNRLAEVCLESPIDIRPRRRLAETLQQRFLAVDNLTDMEPWRGLLSENTVGALPPAVPVFLAQGSTDATVIPSVTRDYMSRLCAAGSNVRLVVMPDVGHGGIATRSAIASVSWMADRFAGKPAPNDCGQL
jgi:pimeloyl-ACP methyl ester carboxylesterase